MRKKKNNGLVRVILKCWLLIKNVNMMHPISFQFYSNNPRLSQFIIVCPIPYQPNLSRFQFILAYPYSYPSSFQFIIVRLSFSQPSQLILALFQSVSSSQFILGHPSSSLFILAHPSSSHFILEQCVTTSIIVNVFRHIQLGKWLWHRGTERNIWHLFKGRLDKDLTLSCFPYYFIVYLL